MKANAFRLLIASVVFGSALPLFADCTVTCTATVPSAGTAGVAVDFESTASPCLCSGAASYFWEFGDGADSTDANPSHTYSSNGTYNWELTVTADSTICTKSGSITIGSVTPPAGTYGGTTSLGHAFSLTVNGSSQITAWSISYSALCGGSGTTNVTGANCAVTNGAFSCNTASCSPFSTQTSISGTFASATSVSGNATLKTMPDAINCCTQEPAFTATISPAPLTAGASGDVTTGTAPLTVNFTGSASGGTPPYSYSWDFGDCSAADTAQNPSHVYSAGNYDVVLTVTDSASATAEAVVPVTALSPPGTFVVTSTNPATNAKAASRTANVQATANAVVNVSTVDQTTFLLQGNQTGRIAGTFSAAGNTFEFDPTDAFKPGELVKVSATSGIESTAPATLTPHVWQFTAATNTANGAMSAHPIAPEFGDGWSSDVTLGDLDGDGDLDAVVANEENAADPETVWLNDGTGTFTAHPAISSFGESQSQAVALGDLDGDGDLDAVVANRQPPNAETVWVNDGGGGFTAHPATPTFGGGESMDLALGDLDGDGDLDAVIANHSGQETVWLNDGAGTFIAHPTTPAFGATIFPANTGFAVGLADLDGDGDLDAVIAHDGPETVWLNDGAGNFTAHATPSFGGDYSNDIAVGDVNGDGYADVVVANDITSETVWLNDGTGIFTQHPTAFSAGSGSTAAVALGDVDGDGDLDAVFALFGHPESIWVNDGSGTFTAHTTFGPLGGGTYSVALGDVDGDGDLDAVLASTGDLAETVWLNYDAEDALAGVNVTPAAVSVSETGTTASFDVVLTYAPMRDVTVNIASGDTGEATVSHSSLTFTPADWSVVRTVTVTGIDDALDDGDGSTTVTLTLTTIDPVYFSIDPADVTVTTLDDEELNVVSVAPAPNTKAAPRNTNVQVTADDTINAATVTAAMFRVQSMQSGRIDGAYSASGTTFQLDPTDDLRPGETVHVSATNGVQSSAAVGLTPYVWQFTAATGAASGALEAHPVAMSAGGNTSDAALGDLDGDGDLDAVVVYNNLPATARLNDGTGDFTTVGDTFDGGDSEAVALGDIDGDGDLDAVIGKWSAAGTVWVNDGSGDFSAHSGTPNLDGDYVWDLVLGDLDGDGDLDAVVITGDNAADKVYLNDGAGNFATHPTAATFGATDGRAGALGDLDADGDLDLLIATTQQGEKVWLNDGTGAFTPHPSTPSFGSEYSLGMALGDIDGDGDLDAIFANAVPLEETVWVNDGTGAFTAHSTATFSDNYSFAVALGDLDGDGDFDAIVGHYSGDPAGIWRNDGSGVFSEHPGGATIAAGAIQAIALGDVEGDGDLDALMASNSPSIWLNRPVPGVTVTPTSGLVTTEAGGTATFTVVLDTRPVADVSIEVSSSDTSEGRVSSDGVTQQDSVALTFTTSNWSTPQTVTVHGRNDSLDDGNVAYTLATGAAASTDALYSGFDAADVAAANSDDDTASVTVEPAAVTVAESGTTDTFTVVLDVEPAGNVVITVTPTDPGEATAGPGQLTFTTGNWSTPQTVTVTGVGDSLADGDQVTTISLTVNTGSTLDPGYDAIDPPDVTVTTVDDVIAISATAPSASTASASRSANVHATTTHPLNPSTVTPSTFLVHGGRTGRLTGNRSTPTATTFQFDPANDFKPGETIHVTATGAIEGTASNSLRPHVWQFTAAAGAGTGAFSAHPTNPNFAAGDYTAVLGDLDEDGDLDAIFISNGNHDTVWLNDGTGAFTFHANFGNVSASKPGIALGDLDGDGDLDAVVTGRFDDETVWLNDGAANFSLHSSFDVNWTTRVALGDLDGDGDLDAVTGHEDAGGRTWLNDGSATFSAHPATPAFGAGGPQEIVLGDVDGDGDLDAVMPGYNGAERVWRNDGAGSFSAGPAFGNDPFGNWDNTWTLGLGDLDGDGDLDALTANMSTQPEKVWLNDGTGTFSAHPAIPGFGAGDSRAVLLGDLDGDGDLDAIVLDALGSSEPVWINDGTGGFSAHPSVPALATGGDSWGGALGDIDGDGDLDAVICGAGNPRQDETVWLNERIVLTPSSGLSTNESGSLVSFEVVLGRQPTANVSFQLSSGDPTEARLSDDGSTQQNALTITFTNSNWSTPQVVTVHGQDDAVTDGTIAYTIVTDAVMSSDPFYSGMNPRDVTGTNADDDSGGVTVSPAAVSVAESGATATFTVVLDVQPAAAVVIDVSSADPAEATVSPAQLTFDTANWSTPQTVTVTGVDDTVDDGDQVTTIDVAVNTAATADPAYDTVDPDDVTATTTDNDTAGVTRTPSAVTVSESGTTATFTVVLLTEPTGDVVLDVTPSDAGEATSSPAQLTFTAGDWSSPQTVTVTGTDDVLDDGNQTSTIVLAMNAGATTDPVYDPINPADVTVTTTDDDKTPSTTTLASSVNPSTSGQSVTFTATVTAGATGTVTFKNGAATLGTVTLASGSASLAVANLAPGTHSITATYNGNATYDVSTSNTVSQTVNLSPFGAPLFFTATGATATSIALNWGAVSGATNYEIYRTDSISTPYALIHTTTATAYTNSGLTANKTYLYKVLANGSVGPSPFSTPDLGTTVIFTDPTLTNAIKVKAAHVTQLRTAINAARTAAGLGAATFTDPAPAIVKRIHFTEMRTALDAARTALGLSAIAYTDPAITVASTKVKAAHVVDLRKGVQ